MHQDWELGECSKRAEQRYSATEMEALAVAATMENFNYYMYGKEFVVYTDHKPLLQFLSSDKLNPRLRRISYKLQHWMLTLEYLPGDAKTFVDALSREERRGERERTAKEDLDVRLVGEDVVAQPPLEEKEK